MARVNSLLLILDAHAMGVNPTNFGGTNLVARLQATEQTSGPDAGLFGTETQLGDYYVGTYVQGLVFTALKAAGAPADAAAISWLTNQQCPGGGWAVPDQAVGVCAEDPSSFQGADDQTTSLVVQGLAAQGALTTTIAANALSFFADGQDADGGWSYYPSAAAEPQQIRLAVHRAGDPGAARHGSITDEPNVHRLRTLSRHCAAVLRGAVGR